MKRFRFSYVLAAVVAIVAALLFQQALSGEFVWDDHNLIENDVTLDAPGIVQRAFSEHYWSVNDRLHPEHQNDRRLYRPLLKLTMAGEHRLFGNAPLPFHLVNLLLHAAVSVLAFAWLRRRTGNDLAALAGALVFVVHPSRAESVAWIAACSDLWAALFALLALELWARREKVGLVPACALFAVAALFKESSVALPAALLVDAALTGSDRKTLKITAIPLVVVAVALSARFLVVPLGSNAPAFGVGARVLRVVGTFGCFVRQTLLPVPYVEEAADLAKSLYHQPRTDPVHVAWGACAMAGLLAIALISWRSRALRPWLADLAWFVVPALPMLNLVPVGGIYYFGDRYLYIPLLGVAALVARAANSVSFRRFALAGTAALSVVWGALTVAHVRDFHSDLVLWHHEYQRFPRDFVVLTWLTEREWAARHYDEAQRFAEELIPVFVEPKDQAGPLDTWMRIEESRVARDPAGLQALRAAVDALADGRPVPEGRVKHVAERVPEAGRLLVREKVPFRLLHARIALETLDFAAAADRYRGLDDASPGERALALTLAGEGGVAIAKLAPALQETQRNTIEAYVASTPPPGTPSEAAARLQVALSLQETPIAVLLARDAIAKYPENAAVRVRTLDAHLLDSDLPAAREDVAVLRRVMPDPARWDDVAHQIDYADALTKSL